MNQNYVLASDIRTHEVILEIWGCSTKHPDIAFKFSDFEMADGLIPESQLFQFILECASKLRSSFSAYCLAHWALNDFMSVEETWRRNQFKRYQQA